jgi:hypothetical protein
MIELVSSGAEVMMGVGRVFVTVFAGDEIDKVGGKLDETLTVDLVTVTIRWLVLVTKTKLLVTVAVLAVELPITVVFSVSEVGVAFVVVGVEVTLVVGVGIPVGAADLPLPVAGGSPLLIGGIFGGLLEFPPPRTAHMN